MSSHVFAVRRLYRRVLTLHRRLPLEQKALGDQYAKDEFRRNKNASIEQAAEFLNEWKIYADVLEQQAMKNNIRGENLQPELVDSFREDQLGQLFELHNEATTKTVGSDKTGSDEH